MRADEQLLSQMNIQAATWESQDDKRFIFLRCYNMMTANMIEAVQQGRFQDGVWVGKLLHRFAAYYFEALEQFEHNDAHTPPVWSQVHDASTHQDLHVLQHLLLGINAHINYDLVLALYDELVAEWTDDDRDVRQQRMADHNMVNTIIGETIDTVQDQVIERELPLMRLVDNLMGRVDEWLLSELISSWRSEVWEECGAMLKCESPENKESLRCTLEKRVMARAEGILHF